MERLQVGDFFLAPRDELETTETMKSSVFQDCLHDDRVLLTLDAGGTSFRFSAMCAGKPVTETLVLPSYGDDLVRCLGNIVDGFSRTRALCPAPPVAISFAFPGPAGQPNGIISDVSNLPAFNGGVPLGPMLEETFKLPVFINNDGDLFAYGEAIAGLLPHVNGLLEKAGTPKRFRNLFGVTLGTGFGGGLVRDGELFKGDNDMAGEVWLLRHKLDPNSSAEEGASIRAVRRVYAQRAGLHLSETPEPKDIAAIALGQAEGNSAAAIAAFEQLGEVVGDAMASILVLVDGLAVIGGGLSGAASLFLPTLVAELNNTYVGPDGKSFRRLTQRVYNLEEPGELKQFLASETRVLPVPGSARTVRHDSFKRIGVGLSRLGTSRAIATGAYAYALRQLDTSSGVVSLGESTL